LPFEFFAAIRAGPAWLGMGVRRAAAVDLVNYVPGAIEVVFVDPDGRQRLGGNRNLPQYDLERPALDGGRDILGFEQSLDELRFGDVPRSIDSDHAQIIPYGAGTSVRQMLLCGAKSIWSKLRHNCCNSVLSRHLRFSLFRAISLRQMRVKIPSVFGSVPR
jgi:hypothetical protein